MASGQQARQHWTEPRRRKEPSMYDEWLAEEKATKAAHREALLQAQAQAQVQAQSQAQDAAVAVGDTAPSARSGSTIRPVTPDTLDSEHPGRGTSSFDRAYVPVSVVTTTITGGGGGSSEHRTSPNSSHSTRLRRDREWDQNRKKSSGSRDSSAANGRGMLGRSSTQGNGEHSHAAQGGRDPYNSNRPRTRTLDERRTRDRSPNSLRHRHRIASVNTTGAPIQGSGGADYLASVPAATSPPHAASLSSLGSPVLNPADILSRRSVSPISSHTVDSIPATLPSANARRIMHLMKALDGRMSGTLLFRRGSTSSWSRSYCFLQEDTGSLLYEPRGGVGVHKTLVSDLRGCSIDLEEDDDAPYINVKSPGSAAEVHLKLANQADLDSWLAALLCWQPVPPKGYSNRRAPARTSAASSDVESIPQLPPRPTMSRSTSERDPARANSLQSNRRKSVIGGTREPPVIKVGKMIFWDTNVTYNNTPASSLGQATIGRPQAYRVQSIGGRRWRRIDGQLRENGELTLRSDSDKTLISVVQLSQLSRCAIQRLDPSVLGTDYCIAIYPQYTSSQNGNSPLLRPIFLSLEEGRVLFEVWFVLLRAFTIPALYGHLPDSDDAGSKDTVSAATADMFRMERSLHVRVVEAKMYPPTSPSTPDASFQGGHGKAPQIRPEQYGYHVEVLLDNETRGKTAAKFEGLNPLWGETFEFTDLPPVLNSASVVIKRRPPEHARAQESQQSKLVNEAYGFTGNMNAEGGYSGITFDVTCGKVEIYLEELAAASEIEKWWPVVNMYNQRVGDILIKARAEEGVILMSRDYQPLNDLLHRFSNNLTLQIAQIVPGELKRLSDCLLNIFQVSGKASDWIMALVEDEIDSAQKETPMNRLRYSRRMNSNESGDSAGVGVSHADRELLVRDMNKNAALEANLLFRGNTLLTKSLDSHMRRVGREYLEEALGARVREINEADPDCEVDPNRITSSGDIDKNWRRLIEYTSDVWKSIVAAKAKCPIELRRIFRHVRACAEDRYGDFLRSVSFSSVSGFLFLRFFCPAVLNPKLFGLMKDDMKPKARRTCTLIAKSLQTLANMASFGTKEHWMEPMNQFLTQHRDSFKGFVDEVCYVPTPLLSSSFSHADSSSPTSTTGVLSAETHLSYTIPMTIMHRLPPTSREGFPSLPYLIDQARCFAELIQLWLESTSQASEQQDTGPGHSGRQHINLLQAIHSSDGDLKAFHDVCSSLHARTQECLSRAERAERPNTPLSFRWDELIDQLERPRSSNDKGNSFDKVADRIASDPTIAPPPHLVALSSSQYNPVSDLQETDEDEVSSRAYDTTPTHSGSNSTAAFEMPPPAIRPKNPRRPLTIQRPAHRPTRLSMDSPTASASPSASNVSSAVSSDTEHTTALPSYQREVRREQAETAVQQQEVFADRKVKKERRAKTLTMPTLRKKKDRDSQKGE